MSYPLPLPPPTAGDGTPSGSASVMVAGSASSYHVLKIDGYLWTKHAIPNGNYVDSRPFCVAGLTWAIRYYPNERRLHLSLPRPQDQGRRGCHGAVLAKLINEVEASQVRAVSARRFSAQILAWGCSNFIKREDLEQSGRVKDDCFTVRCDMIVIGKLRAEDTVTSSIVVPPPDWLQHFQTLLQSGLGADVSIVVRDEAFVAHCCVLAARSPVFNAALFGAMKEGTSTIPCIQIGDMLPQVFKCLLHFIYTDTLPEIEGEDASSPAMMQHLLEAADRYGMQRLKLMCGDRLCRYIDVNTVATTLTLAEQHHCQGLKEACFNFFLKSSETLNAVKETDGFQHLVKSCPSVILQLMSKLAAR